jgi:cold shock CspA family protein
MPQGKVKYFDAKKSYGFIHLSDEEQQEVFVHLLDVEESRLQSLEKE